MSEPEPPQPTSRSWLRATLYARRGVLTALAVLAALGLIANGAWNTFGPAVARSQQYLLTPQSVAVSAPPPWVRDDIVAAAFQFGQLEGDVSVLDPPEQLERRLAAAISAHPWVRCVGAISKSPPNRVGVEVEYRRPLAVADIGGNLLPVDVDGAVLPTRDLPAESLRYLPRIDLTDASVRPPAPGAVWAEPRLAGAVALVDAFGELWNQLYLFTVRIDRTPEVRAGQRFWSYNLISTGNTVVVWGAAPGFGPPDEVPFAKKLESLRRVIAKEGPLDSVANGPGLIDVREGGVTYPRVVMKEKNRVASKDDEGETAVK